MKIKRGVVRLVNRALSHLGVVVTRLEQDFDRRLESPRHLAILFDELALPVEQWINGQRLFPMPNGPIQVRPEIERFYSEYLKSPFRGKFGGSRFNNLLWLSLIARAMQPTIIIDSGTYMGGSAWALSLGCADSPRYSFDLDLSMLKMRMPNVQYIQSDWTTLDVGKHDLSRGLCYFDDHVDQARRLIEAAERGFLLAIFDDDFPITSTAIVNRQGVSLPKVEFVLDDRLRSDKQLCWSEKGVQYVWQVDSAYLDMAKSVIAATDRLPDTSLTTGIQQTPYRIVTLRKPTATVLDARALQRSQTLGRRG